MSANLIAPWQPILQSQRYIDRYLSFNGMAHGESTPTGYDALAPAPDSDTSTSAFLHPKFMCASRSQGGR